nr:hypothetical protein [uncultured Duganella sp.]
MSRSEVNLLIAFKRISEALELLSGEELSRLCDPQYSVEVRVVRRRTKDDKAALPTDTVIDDAVKEITGLPSREDAQALLSTRYPSKKALELIARRLDIPIIKQDKLEELRDKIVEATVGSRIRSQAIQGTGS